MRREGLRRDRRGSDLQRGGTAPDDLNVGRHQVVQVTGVTLRHDRRGRTRILTPSHNRTVRRTQADSHLLTTDGCHGDRRSCAAFYGDCDVTRHLRGDGNVSLVGRWRRGDETTWHR